MVQTFFKRPCTIHRLRRGPLAGHIDLLAAKLATEGFSRVHSRIQLRLVGHFVPRCPCDSQPAAVKDEVPREMQGREKGRSC